MIQNSEMVQIIISETAETSKLKGQLNISFKMVSAVLNFTLLFCLPFSYTSLKDNLMERN